MTNANDDAERSDAGVPPACGGEERRPWPRRRRCRAI